jgi:hypothetical protein
MNRLDITPQAASIIGDALFLALDDLAHGREYDATLTLDELHDQVGRVRYGSPADQDDDKAD